MRGPMGVGGVGESLEGLESGTSYDLTHVVTFTSSLHIMRDELWVR